ncbi:hypothetical protein CONPUDRAFT_67069, partial [Coniophora puteana RWD-64-598 SS2]
QLGDIQTIYHPRSGRVPVVEPLSDFDRRRHPDTTAVHASGDESPWTPWRSREDFELSELAIEGALSHEQTDPFTLQGCDEMKATFEAASKTLTPFEKHDIPVTFNEQNATFNFELWDRSLWDWGLDLLSNPRLQPHFVFDAQRVSKYNGTQFVRFIDEPWTANDFWTVQSQLPEGGKPFAFILYADKSVLSSFGTQKGYPVVARCANLPAKLRNSTGPGGGQVVGWLPIVDEEDKYKGTTDWANFKNIVWHKSFEKLFESLEGYAKTGFWFKFQDGSRVWLFPIILILSADFEEQCQMTALRGGMANHPCPVCLVEKKDLASSTEPFRFRTSEQSKAVYEEAMSARNTTVKEETLKKYGLRPVQNAFWKLKYTDVHMAISWDRMHAHHHGLWGNHLWKAVKACAGDLGRLPSDQLDNQIDSMPRWAGLGHIKNALNVDFTDASKEYTLSKVIIFGAHNVLDREMVDTHHIPYDKGYHLLNCVRLYLNFDMYMGLEQHTQETLAAARAALQAFVDALADYVIRFDSNKNWNFPKNHSNHHAIRDILAKGVTSVYNTKPNESMHRSLRESYKYRTNFKEIALQVLRIELWLLVLVIVREHITAFDRACVESSAKSEPSDEKDTLVDDLESSQTRFTLGSKAPGSAQSLQDLQDTHLDDSRFNNLSRKFEDFINSYFVTHNLSFPKNERICITSSFKVKEHRMLRLRYQSIVDNQMQADLLRCAPDFHHRARNDCLALNAANTVIFVRLLLMFTCDIGDRQFSFALVDPYDSPIFNRSQRDRDFGLWRVRGSEPPTSRFIAFDDMIRGAALVKDFEGTGDHFVLDTVDSDWFLRVQTFWSRVNTNTSAS